MSKAKTEKAYSKFFLQFANYNAMSLDYAEIGGLPTSTVEHRQLDYFVQVKDFLILFKRLKLTLWRT